MVGPYFLSRGELFFDGAVGFLGRLGFNDLEPVENAVHVGVDAYVRQIVEHGEHDFRGLDSYPRERLNL